MREVKIFCFILAMAIIAPAIGIYARAATRPQVLITWKTVGSVAPANYQGKILSRIGAEIAASVQVIANGKLVNLGAQTVYWYLDDNFLGGGAGKDTLFFAAPGHLEIMSLRVNLPDYPGGELINTAHIQMVGPQVVIVAPYPNGSFTGSSVALQAVPYFFGLLDAGKLFFQWTVNGEAVATRENPEDLAINLASGAPSGYSLAVNLLVTQSNNPLMTLGAGTTLTKASQ